MDWQILKRQRIKVYDGRIPLIRLRLNLTSSKAIIIINVSDKKKIGNMSSFLSNYFPPDSVVPHLRLPKVCPWGVGGAKKEEVSSRRVEKKFSFLTKVLVHISSYGRPWHADATRESLDFSAQGQVCYWLYSPYAPLCSIIPQKRGAQWRHSTE